jgi:hypothetical protein
MFAVLPTQKCRKKVLTVFGYILYYGDQNKNNKNAWGKQDT